MKRGYPQSQRVSSSSGQSAGYCPGREADIMRLSVATAIRREHAKVLQHSVGEKHGVSVDRYGTTFARLKGPGAPVYATVIAPPRRTRSVACRERIKKAVEKGDLEKLREAYQQSIQGDTYIISSREVNVALRKIADIHDKALAEAMENEDTDALRDAIMAAEVDAVAFPPSKLAEAKDVLASK